jgi:hypothetical protein
MLTKLSDSKKVTTLTVLFLGAIIGGLVTWYSSWILAIQSWPKPLRTAQLHLRRAEDRVFLGSPSHPWPRSQEDESAYSRNSERHPHW